MTTSNTPPNNPQGSGIPPTSHGIGSGMPPKRPAPPPPPPRRTMPTASSEPPKPNPSNLPKPSSVPPKPIVPPKPMGASEPPKIDRSAPLQKKEPAKPAIPLQKTTTSPQLNVPPKGNVPPGKTPPPPGSTGTPPVGTAGKPEGKKEEKKSGKRVLLILLIISAILNVLLLAGGGYTVVKYDNQVDSLSTYGNELRTELDQTMEDLDQYKGQSEKLDKMLAAAKLELDTTRVKIEKMLAEGNQDKETIDQLRHELRRIKRKREKFEEEIDRLLLENRELKSKNLDLSVAVGNLEEEKEVLSEKVTIASKIPVEYATITGLKMKGKAFKETALAKKVEKFSICFDVMENKVVEPGNKVLYLRISGPAGEVLGNKELGSGSFVDAESGKEKLFTVQKDIDYRNDRQNYCVDWEDPSKETYDPGTYVAEFYLDGFKAGTTSFILR